MAKHRQPRPTGVRKMLSTDGALCVTFVNTARRKALDSYDDLIAWGVETGALGAAEAPRLGHNATERPGVAGGVARRARTLRARLERMFLALATDENITVADFKAFNTELRAALAARHMIQTTTGYRWAWAVDRGEEDDLDRMLWPILYSAAELLTSDDRLRVRQCLREDCGLFFIARGAGSKRKWCNRACGERTRSGKHYRQKVKPQHQARLRKYRQNVGVRMEREAFNDEPDGETP